METERSAPFPSSAWRQSSNEKTYPAHSSPTSGLPGPAGTDSSKSAEHLNLKSLVTTLAMNDIKHEKDGIERGYTAYPPAAVSQPAPQLSSPAGSYSGPPPPYSTYHQTATSAVSHASHAAYNSPPESRRDSREDRSAADAQQRQALPSISEALGRLSGISPTAATSVTSHPTGALPPSQQDAHGHGQYAHPARPRVDVYQASPRPYSPALQRHDAYESRAPPPHRGLSNGSSIHSPSLNHQHHHHRSSMSSNNLSPVDPPTQHGSPRLRQSYTSVPQAQYYTSAVQSPQQTSNPPLSARSASEAFPHSQSQHQSSGYPPQPAAMQSTPLRPPPPEQPYSQAQQPNQAYSFPPPQTTGLTYEQSLQQASLAQQQYRHWPPNPEFEKVEEQRRAAALAHPDRGTGPGSYAVTVKRHLDDFDIENNLNDLAERTSRIMDFSKTYGVKAHQYPRSAIPVTELPKMEDCDRMIDEAVALRTALERLRRAVEQQNRLAEQTAVQQSQTGKHGMPGQSPFGTENGVAGHGLANSDKNSDKADASGGFANGDSKKRRGRNAPPGRCHSCNRVETPEWRRGPDGARTLCNACGLHYAKLTKKLNSGKDKTTSEASPVEST